MLRHLQRRRALPRRASKCISSRLFVPKCRFLLLYIVLFRSSAYSLAVSPKCRSFSTAAPQSTWTNAVAVAAALGISVAFSGPCLGKDDGPSWQLANGEVHFSEPLRVRGRQLYEPRLLGSGGGGAVFAFRPDDDENDAVAVKVSWHRSAASVENECAILRRMEGRKVTGVERCLAQERYPGDERRAMIVMVPVVEDSVAAVSSLKADLRPYAVRCIVRTMVQMLDARVVTTDVQPLISKSTGDVLFVDMTEAKEIQRYGPLPFLDLAISSSFCTEMMSLIPEDLSEDAGKALLEALRNVSLPHEIYDVLRSQTQVMTEETIAYIDAMAGPP